MVNINEVVITEAGAADAEEIFRIQRAAYQSEAEIYNNYSIQPLTQTFDESLAEFKDSTVLKAVLNGVIIGSVRAREKGGTVYVGKLMVLPACQNKGVGRRLLTAVEERFNGGRYELYTGAGSEKNIALYKKCGYKAFKPGKDESGFAFVYMEKLKKLRI